MRSLAVPFVWGVLLAASAMPAGAAETDVDRFLGGFLEGCRMGQEFNAFHQSLADKYTPGGNPSGVLVLSRTLAPLVGRYRVAQKDGYTDVRVEFGGTFRGVPVEALGFSLGNGNGIVAWSVEFAADPGTVRAAFGPAVIARSKRLLKKIDDMDFGFSTELDLTKRPPRLWCDTST